MLYNPGTQRWERCPEGRVLLDAKYAGDHLWDLANDRKDVVAKVFLTGMLAHEFAHLSFVLQGDTAGVPRTTEEALAGRLMTWYMIFTCTCSTECYYIVKIFLDQNGAILVQMRKG
jgi:hypothetical protein